MLGSHLLSFCLISTYPCVPQIYRPGQPRLLHGPHSRGRGGAPPGRRPPEEPQLPDLGEGAVVVQPPHLPRTLPRRHRVERDRDLYERRHSEFYLENVAQLL